MSVLSTSEHCWPALTVLPIPLESSCSTYFCPQTTPMRPVCVDMSRPMHISCMPTTDQEDFHPTYTVVRACVRACSHIFIMCHIMLCYDVLCRCDVLQGSQEGHWLTYCIVWSCNLFTYVSVSAVSLLHVCSLLFPQTRGRCAWVCLAPGTAPAGRAAPLMCTKCWAPSYTWSWGPSTPTTWSPTTVQLASQPPHCCHSY